LLWWEIVSVFAVSLGASGFYAFVSYIGSLTARQALSSQQVIINGSHAPGRPLLDLFLQLVSLAISTPALSGPPACRHWTSGRSPAGIPL